MELIDGYCLKRCTKLCCLFLESATPELEFVKKRFDDEWTHFSETLDLAEHLGLIQRIGESFQLTSLTAMATDRPNKGAETSLREIIRSALLYGSSDVSKKIKGYLASFSFDNDHFIFSPAMNENLQQAGIRNLLISMEVIEYDSSADIYRIIDTNPLLSWSSDKKQKLTRQQLIKLNEERQKVGLTAELAVLQHERLRLADFPQLVKRIEHVAEKDVGAGYDILSFEIPTTDGRASERYIEVKATPASIDRFHWSRNEILVARKMGERYHLYLLPMKNSTTCETERMVQIQDPYRVIYMNEETWTRNCDSMTFDRNINDRSEEE